MNEVIDILKKVGAIIANDHFVGTSGLHFDTYINKDFLYPHTKETSRICRILAEKFKDANIEVVVGPALGGIILSQWTAYHLSEICGKEVLGVYTEKSLEGGQIFTRGYENYVRGKRVLVVEDIITTGGSLFKTIKAVQEAGGNIISSCAMVNKNKDIKESLSGVPFYALSDSFVFTYEANVCPLCKNKIPINTKVGHGKKFLDSKK
jgi:orotate phosphoribosyltransferase